MAGPLAFDKVRAILELAIAADTLASEPRYAMACACAAAGELDEAERHFHLALALGEPNYDAYMALGDISVARFRLDAAATYYQAARTLRPDLSETAIRLSNVAKLTGDFSRALEWLTTIPEGSTDYATARWNRALILLEMGDLEAGFAAYECRWALEKFKFRRPNMPLWDGSDLAGRSILLIAEQGWGDQIQFARYAAVLKSMGARVVLATPANGGGLFDRLDGVNSVVEGRRFPPACDFYIPLLSVPHLVGTNVATIPAHIPYLHADPELIRTWDARLGARDGKRIGIVCREPPAILDAAYRDFPATALVPIVQTPGMRFFSLTLDPVLPALRDHVTELDRTRSFADTAAIVANMDLVIAPDSVYCHLAGALGIPLWALLGATADWRWRREGASMPWYPSARLFRQTTLGIWDDVMDRVADALSKVGAGAALG